MIDTTQDLIVKIKIDKLENIEKPAGIVVEIVIEIGNTIAVKILIIEIILTKIGIEIEIVIEIINIRIIIVVPMLVMIEMIIENVLAHRL